MNINAILNFMPGYKRHISVVIGVALYAWHLAFQEGLIGTDVPTYVMAIAGLFGYNALSQGSKNDAAKVVAEVVATKQS